MYTSRRFTRRLAELWFLRRFAVIDKGISEDDQFYKDVDVAIWRFGKAVILQCLREMDRRHKMQMAEKRAVGGRLREYGF